MCRSYRLGMFELQHHGLAERTKAGPRVIAWACLSCNSRSQAYGISGSKVIAWACLSCNLSPTSWEIAASHSYRLGMFELQPVDVTGEAKRRGKRYRLGMFELQQFLLYLKCLIE